MKHGNKKIRRNNPKIERIYNKGIKAGASGGKLLRGCGFILRLKKIRKNLKII